MSLLLLLTRTPTPAAPAAPIPLPGELDSWSAVCEDLQGRLKGYLDFETLRLTVKVKEGRRCSLTVDALDEGAQELEVASRAIAVRHGEALRFRGKIDDPLEDGATEVQVNAADPLVWLRDRRIQAEPVASRVFSQRDAGQIGRDLVAAQDARSPTRLRVGAVSASVLRDRTYEPGKVVGEAIRELAEVDDGFWPVCHPLDGVPGMMGELEVRYPQSGPDRPGVRFEFGDGTLGNIEEGWRRTRLRPVNRVTATGAGDGESRPVAASEDPVSVALYDLIEDEVALSSVIEEETLAQHARERVRPRPVSVYSFTPAAYGPRLFLDFDVGDIVRLTIRHGRVQDIGLPVRVTEATLEVDKDSEDERISGLVVETV